MSSPYKRVALARSFPGSIMCGAPFACTNTFSFDTECVLLAGNNANVGSPVNLRAIASPTAGHSITGWRIYADGISAYSAAAVNSINANLGLKVGTHTLVVRTWDTSGAYGDRTLNLTVSAKPAVAVATPVPGSSLASPIYIHASATPSAGAYIQGWHIYLDGTDKYAAGAVSSISSSIPASKGQHTVVVRAWDSSGAFGDQTLSLQVP